MSESSNDVTSAEKSCNSVTEVKVEPGISISPKKKRHVIKGNNVKPVGNGEKSKSSPLTKSLDLLGRLSKKGKAKNKNQTHLNESHEATYCVESQKAGNSDLEQTSPSSSKHDCVIDSKTDTSMKDLKPKKMGTKKRASK